MSDTQWPRWEVFLQSSERRPHQAVGTVHAADSEHALFNARDVFVRRPKTVSLWVAPSSEIYSKTVQELAEPWFVEPADDAQQQNYYIFRKTNQRRSMTFVDFSGEQQARSPQEALKQALEQFADEETFVWWIVPESAIVRSDDVNPESWFEPAADKKYKQQSQYGFVSARRRRRKGRQKD